MNVKVQEKQNKWNRVAHDHQVKPVRKVARDEVVVRTMRENQHELNLKQENDLIYNVACLFKIHAFK